MPQSSNAMPRTSAAGMVLAALMLSLLTQCYAWSEEQTPQLFVAAIPGAPAAAARGLAREETRARVAALNVAALCGAPAAGGRAAGAQRVALNLFDDTVFTAVFDRVDVKGPQRVTYCGALDGVPGSQVTMALDTDAISAIVDIPGKAHYAVSCVGNGAHRIVEFEPALMPPTLERGVLPAPGAAPRAAASRAVVVVDVMVIYTEAVLNNNGGPSGITSLIDNAVADANTVLTNSQVNAQFRLVHSAQTSYVTSGDDATDLDRLTNTSDGYMDDVHSLRDQYGADLVCLLNTNNRGIAWVPKPPSARTANTGFSVVGDTRIKDHTYIHEAGHNFGLAHDRANSSTSGAFDYSYGYVFVAQGTQYGTVMAYPGTRISYFSNPNVSYQGVATGVPAGQSDSADNARALNETASTIAAYRNTVVDSAPNQAPQASITSPSEGATFTAPANIQITASASDPDTNGSVTKVEFYAGSTKISEVTSAPYSATFANAPAGEFTLTAVATDNLGAATTSAGVKVKVAGASAPPNDNFAARISINGLPSGVTGGNVDASKEPGETDHAGLQGGRSVWWTWTAAAAGRVKVIAKGEGFEAILAVYTGASLSALTAVGSDNGAFGSGAAREVLFTAAASTAYQIVVDSSDGKMGSVTVQVVGDEGSRPGNDAFANRFTLSGATAAAYGSNANASLETWEPEHGHASSISASVWWTWTAPASGPVVMSTAGSTLDTVLAVYTGTALTSLLEVGSNDDERIGVLTSRVAFTAAAGTAYQIAVASYGTPEGGTHDLALSIAAGPGAPANDAFSARIALGSVDFARAAGDNQSATAETGEPDHAANSSGNSVWWTWTAPGSGSVTISTQGSTYDTVLAVYQGAAVDGLTEVASNDDQDYANYVLTSLVSFTATGGQSYEIAVSGAAPPAMDPVGLIALTLWMTAPVNDAFASATALSGAAGTTQGYNMGAVGETGEPRHANATGDADPSDGIDLTKWASVWWKWTAAADGMVTVTTEGSTFDTVLAVYTGSAVGSLAEVVSNDDASSVTYSSAVRFSAANGTTYYIAVDGYAGGTGAVTLNLNQAALPTVTVAASDGSGAEAAQDKITFTVTSSAAPASDLTVRYTLGGQAINGTDFTGTPPTVTIPAGATSAAIEVTPVDDTYVEGPEDVTITLLNDSAYLLGTSASAKATLTDNDELPVVTIAATDASATEAGDTGAFTISRSGSTANELTVELASGGTAANGTDYTALSSPVKIAAGASSAAIQVAPIADSTAEGDETVVIGLNSGAGFIVGSPSSATVTLSDSPSSAPLVLVPSYKHQFKLNFSASGSYKDSLAVTVTSFTDFGFSDKTTFLAETEGKPVAAAIGSQVLDTATMVSGKAAGDGKFQWNYRKGEIRYQVRNVNLKDLLGPYGATNRDAYEAIGVPLFIGVGDTWYGDLYSFTYKAKAGKSGSGK